jgi:hypothetical protein
MHKEAAVFTSLLLGMILTTTWAPAAVPGGALKMAVVHNARQIDLLPVGSDADAKGTAETSTREENQVTTEQGFSVSVAKLDPVTSFTLVVNGNAIESFTTGRNGGAQLKYSTNPGGNEEPLPSVINPVSSITNVEIWNNSTGVVILRGIF